MTKKKLVLNTETLRLLTERDAEGVQGGSMGPSVTRSKAVDHCITQLVAGPQATTHQR